MKTFTWTAASALAIGLFSSPIAAQDKSALEALTYLTDMDAIRQTILRYPLAIDERDFAGFENLFIPSAQYMMPNLYPTITGASNIRRSIEASVVGVTTQHMVGSEAIDIRMRNGAAKAISNFIETIHTVGPINKTTVAHGRFEDELIRTKNGSYYPAREWRFKSRSFSLVVRSFPHFPVSSPLQIGPGNLGGFARL